MTTPDPTCTINGAPTPADVTGNVTVNGALATTAGANFWSVTCISTDELNTAAAINATLVVNQGTKTFSFTSSTPLGSAAVFQSVVGIRGLGLDANSVFNKSFVTTFKVNVLAGNGARVLAENETFEQNPAAGWVAVINPALRQGVSVGVTVSGTGWVHITGGAVDPAARAINLASVDVTGLLPWLNGGHLQGDLHVTNASSPGLFTPLLQIAFMQSDTGTTSVTFPAAAAFPGSVIPGDQQYAVIDSGGVSGTSAITVTPNGSPVWNPTTLAYTASAFTLANNGAAFQWIWDSTEIHWAPLAGTFGSQFGTGPLAAVANNYTMSATDFQIYVVAGRTVTMPAAPLVRAKYKMTQVSGAFETSPLTINGNGYNVWNPNMTNPYDNAATVKLGNSVGSPEWTWNGTLMVLTS